MFSIMTMASSTMKPDAMLSAMSERLSRLKPQAAITPKVAISDTGNVTLGMSVAQNFRRKIKMTRTTRLTVISERALNVGNRCADRRGAVGGDVDDKIRAGRFFRSAAAAP